MTTQEQLRVEFFDKFAYDNHSEDYSEIADYWLAKREQELADIVMEIEKLRPQYPEGADYLYNCALNDVLELKHKRNESTEKIFKH